MVGSGKQPLGEKIQNPEERWGHLEGSSQESRVRCMEQRELCEWDTDVCGQSTYDGRAGAQTWCSGEECVHMHACTHTHMYARTCSHTPLRSNCKGQCILTPAQPGSLGERPDQKRNPNLGRQGKHDPGVCPSRSC